MRSDRRGRTISSHINVGRLGTQLQIRLFNQLPLFVRNTTICSPTSQITDNKSSDTHRTPTENEKTPPSLSFTQTEDMLSPILSQQDHSNGLVNNTSQSPITNVLNLAASATSLRDDFAMCEKVINEKHQFLVAMLDGMDKKSWDSLKIY